MAILQNYNYDIIFRENSSKCIPYVTKTMKTMSNTNKNLSVLFILSFTVYRQTCTRFGCVLLCPASLIVRFMGPTWGPSGSDRTQVGPMLVPWTLLSGVVCHPLLGACGAFNHTHQACFVRSPQWQWNNPTKTSIECEQLAVLHPSYQLPAFLSQQICDCFLAPNTSNNTATITVYWSIFTVFAVSCAFDWDEFLLFTD